MRNVILFAIIMGVSLLTPTIDAQAATKRDPSTQIKGTYKVSRMTIFVLGQAPKVVNFGQPGQQMSAVITAKRKSQRYVILTFSQFQNDTQQMSFRYGEAYLRTTSKGYDLAIDGNKMGMADGTNLTIDMSASDRETGKKTRTLIVCKKS